MPLEPLPHQPALPVVPPGFRLVGPAKADKVLAPLQQKKAPLTTQEPEQRRDGTPLAAEALMQPPPPGDETLAPTAREPTAGELLARVHELEEANTALAAQNATLESSLSSARRAAEPVRASGSMLSCCRGVGLCPHPPAQVAGHGAESKAATTSSGGFHLQKTRRNFAVVFCALLVVEMLILLVPDYPSRPTTFMSDLLRTRIVEVASPAAADPEVPIIGGNVTIGGQPLAVGVLLPAASLVFFFVLLLVSLPLLEEEEEMERGKTGKEKRYSLSELQALMKPHETWLLIRGSFYNITPFVAKLRCPTSALHSWSISRSHTLEEVRRRDAASVLATWIQPWDMGWKDECRFGRADLEVKGDSLPLIDWRHVPFFPAGALVAVLAYTCMAFPRFLIEPYVQLLAVWWFGAAFTALMLVFYLVSRPLNIKFRTSLRSNIVWCFHVVAGLGASTFSLTVFFTHTPLPHAILTFVCDLIHGSTILIQTSTMHWGDSHVTSASYTWLALVKMVFAILLLRSCATEGQQERAAGDATSLMPFEVAIRYGLILQAFAYQRFFIFAMKHLTGQYYYTLSTIMCGMFCGFYAAGMFVAGATWLVVMMAYHSVPERWRPNANYEDKLYVFSREVYKERLKAVLEENGLEELVAVARRKDAETTKRKACLLESVLDTDGDGLEVEEWTRLWTQLGLKADGDDDGGESSQILQSFSSDIFLQNAELTHMVFDELVATIRSEGGGAS
jgi:hypothetical protein